MDCKLAGDLMGWVKGHAGVSRTHIGLRPYGRDRYKCSCGAHAPVVESLAHSAVCPWKIADGDPDVAEFTRVRVTASLMASIGTMKASILGSHIADFDREMGARPLRMGVRYVEECVLEFLESTGLPKDVMDAVAHGYMINELLS